MKRYRQLFFAAALCIPAILSSCNGTATDSSARLVSLPDDSFNFIVANDLGRNGYYDQKYIAEQMGRLAENVDIEFVAAAGDVHHFEGVASVYDPLWLTDYEQVYSHPELMLEWYPVLGNHEYRGNTQAVLDYGTISRRWCMPARYYTQSYEIDDDASLRIVYVDTTPMIDKYRNETDEDGSYPDVPAQDLDEQLRWVDSVLMASDETWKIVIGHHPVYAETPKDAEERTDMQARLDPILRKHGVDMYVGGHIHNFQHIKPAGSDIDYVVNSSASLSRKVAPIEGTVFCSPVTGFSVISATGNQLKLYMLDKDCNILHTVVRSR